MKQAAFDHAQACRLALVAEAMGELGFFEEWGSELYLEGVTELYPALKEIAMQAGEDMHVWAGLSQGPAIRERVERDIEEGLRLGLRGVPAIFVNGRQLASTDPGKVEEIFEAIESGRFSDSAE
jgi:protein-disulfide isomerase